MQIKNEFTKKEFRKKYPNEEACLDELFKRTYGNIECCPKCKSTLGYSRVKSRKAYQCRKCYFQIYPMRGTAFENTKIALIDWFYVMFAFTTTKNGLACHEIVRAIGVSPKSALRMLRKIREFITNDESLLSGEVEIDETFVGGKNKNRHYNKKVAKSQGRSYKDKTPVIGMIERSSGRVIAKAAKSVTQTTLHPILFKHISKGSILLTDEYRGYRGLERYYHRESCNHSKKEFRNKDGSNASTNMMENFWSVLKRTISGSYISINHRKYLDHYVNEVVFRFNNRFSSNLFNDLLCCLLPSSPVT